MCYYLTEPVYYSNTLLILIAILFITINIILAVTLRIKYLISIQMVTLFPNIFLSKVTTLRLNLVIISCTQNINIVTYIGCYFGQRFYLCYVISYQTIAYIYALLKYKNMSLIYYLYDEN